jgi:hypothetical protein
MGAHPTSVGSAGVRHVRAPDISRERKCVCVLSISSSSHTFLNSLHRTMPGDLEAEEAILDRAAEMRRLGAFIGLFEWVCWSEHTQVNVHMLIGSQLIDLRGMFAPGLGDLPDDSPSNVPIATQV